MKSSILLPSKFKKIGWFILIPSMIAGLLKVSSEYEFVFTSKVFAFIYDESLTDTRYFGINETDITNTLISVCFIVGALLVAFSSEKSEDEYIASLRLNSLQWAVLVNYLLLIVTFIFIYGVSFLNIMLYNMFTVLIIFIARVHYLLYKTNQLTKDDELS